MFAEYQPSRSDYLCRHSGRAMERAGGGNKKRERSEREEMEINMTEIVRAREAEGRQRGLVAEPGRRAFFFLHSLYFSPLHTIGTLPDIQ